ncbi:MAG: hypothetical protein IID41_14425, partial [Planctomycetes bacterium]|nr:hypothetical protein [Planctomycetota bacterium]
EVEDKLALFSFISSTLNAGLSLAQGPVSAAFPGGAIIFGVLTGAAGLFLNRPGTAAKMAGEKEASFNEGMKRVNGSG